jgi:hypothetical protein
MFIIDEPPARLFTKGSEGRSVIREIDLKAHEVPSAHEVLGA